MENEVSDFILFIGRFHPLVVHLPIGFLIIAGILHMGSKFNSFRNSAHIVDFTLLLGGISAALACILGYMLSLEGGYNEDAVFLHQWAGIGLTIFSFALLVYRKKGQGRSKPLVQRIGFVLVLILLTYTGHLGGNLTHGSSYLFQYAPNMVRKVAGFSPKVDRSYKKITHIDSAMVFEDVLMPMLDARCISCHNSDKQKGELLLTSFENMMKGGESGQAIVPGSSVTSELYKRITLAHDDEDFMPPEGKTPLSKAQIGIIEWWIDAGAKSKATLVDLGASGEVKDRIEKYLEIGKYKTVLNDPIDPIDQSTIDNLISSGFNVGPLSENLNYLDVSVTIGQQITRKQLEVLKEVSEHIAYLDLKNSGITDNHLDIINSFSNLIRLRLDRNNITDAGIGKLANLENLEYLNLSFTNITNESLVLAQKFKNLKQIYYYNTSVKGSE
ncbi:c-type cytochrome domain-containing protein [Pareuzebyella sediminis]|uniref:c-type cytochrome domain-containing protein n=1 Tax=Pareuzebyella sediminis TaxID=2607998 RepID=UPI0011EC26F7|nr:c-type cytochrome domain-containing protein [Pareuzebyella sediminis]